MQAALQGGAATSRPSVPYACGRVLLPYASTGVAINIDRITAAARNLNLVIYFSNELTRHTGYRIARLAFEARYSGTHEPFSNSGSRLCDQDLKDFDLSGGIFAMKPV